MLNLTIISKFTANIKISLAPTRKPADAGNTVDIFVNVGGWRRPGNYSIVAAIVVAAAPPSGAEI